jgi:hypothetical protein
MDLFMDSVEEELEKKSWFSLILLILNMHHVGWVVLLSGPLSVVGLLPSLSSASAEEILYEALLQLLLLSFFLPP